MSDEFFENIDFNEEKEEKIEPVQEIPDFLRKASEPLREEPELKQAIPEEETPEPVQEIPEFLREASEPLYDDLAVAQELPAEPVVSAPQATYEQPVYTNPYKGYATYNQPVANVNPYSGSYQKAADNAPSASSQQEVPKSETDFNAGLYHQSYQSQSVGNHVKYPRPSTGYENPAPNPYTAEIYSHSNNRSKKEKSKGLTKGGIAALLIVCILVSGLAGFGGSIFASKMNSSQYVSDENSTMVIHKIDPEELPADTQLVDKPTSEIASEVADSVVEITTEIMQTSTFYGQYIAQGAGSGVIISEDGYILTNNHVIDGASSVKVTTRGGNSYDATLVGKDAELDIALLKVEATGLRTAVFGDSSTLAVGAKTVIIGNPLGTLGGSVTEGIISALDRAIAIDGKMMHLLQTDAAVNPGNSGGGMFNGQGELTGIVVAKSSSEDIDNIGFVIPINDVLDILDDLKDYGYVRGRADTGMTFIDLTNQMYAWYYYRNTEAGVYVSSVESGSNAEQAGFRKGDRIVTMDGKEVSSSDDITAYMADKSVGDTVVFEVERSGSKGTLELTLEEYVPVNDNTVDVADPYDNGNPFSDFFGR